MHSDDICIFVTGDCGLFRVLCSSYKMCFNQYHPVIPVLAVCFLKHALILHCNKQRLALFVVLLNEHLSGSLGSFLGWFHVVRNLLCLCIRKVLLSCDWHECHLLLYLAIYLFQDTVTCRSFSCLCCGSRVRGLVLVTIICAFQYLKLLALVYYYQQLLICLGCFIFCYQNFSIII